MYQPENNNFSFHTKKLNVNSKLVSKMEASMSFNKELIEFAVQNNKHNHLSATYYLLLKKYTAQAWGAQERGAPGGNNLLAHQSIEVNSKQTKTATNQKSVEKPQSAVKTKPASN